MHCSENENVCSVKKENNLGFYRLHTIWKNDGFFINITSKDGAWRGEMTPSDVSKMSGQLQVEPEIYLSQCKEALTSHDGQPGMVYAVENGSFSWKKVIDEDSGMKMRMGSVMVEPASFVDTIQNLVHAALNCNKKLQKALNELSEEKKKILENKNDLLGLLNELTETKNKMENDLYARFLLLLNSKKSKIEALENALEEELKKNKQIYAASRKAAADNPYEVDTDDDSDFEKVHKGSSSSSSVKGKGKPPRRGAKGRKNNRFLEETPREKKTKNMDDQNLNYTKNLSPAAATSEGVPTAEKVEIPSTEDDILDYFCGNS